MAILEVVVAYYGIHLWVITLGIMTHDYVYMEKFLLWISVGGFFHSFLETLNDNIYNIEH